MKTSTNIAINAVLIAALVAAMAYVGPSIDMAEAQVDDAIKAQQKAMRFEKAAQAACGLNAAWREQEDGTIRCYLHNGKNTPTVFQVSEL